jgi:YfiH family protein
MPDPDYIVVDTGLARVSIVVTTRLGGLSSAPYASLNLAMHVADEVDRVQSNRDLLAVDLRFERPPFWLDQVHGVEVISADESEISRSADGSITKINDTPLAIMTADCLPIILWDQSGTVICALHAGWRGLANGIIKRGAELVGSGFSAFIGPGIGACHYEVDDAVRQQFESKQAFSKTRPGHYRFDLVEEAKRQLIVHGGKEVDSMDVCTACDERFYSYRRDGETGRFATLDWLND